ncbi:hypothetical protein H7X87_00645 [Acetobacteraceae bacterium]|nr:hypothetical protein [Candidatus Parcubacteria bacterium]
MFKMVGGIVLVILAVAGGLYFYQQQAMKTASTQTATSTSSENSWSFKEADSSDVATGAPMTTVVLTRGGREYTVGTYVGSCSEISESGLQESEVSGVVCWFAGGGNEIGVFSENGTYVVKVGDVDEGSAEEGGFRGNFKTIFPLP